MAFPGVHSPPIVKKAIYSTSSGLQMLHSTKHRIDPHLFQLAGLITIQTESDINDQQLPDYPAQFQPLCK